VGRALQIAILGALPVALVMMVFWESARLGEFALDFHDAFWHAGRSVLEGRFAYDPRLRGGDPFVYPPLTAVLFAPIASLPVGAAEVIYTIAGIAAVLVALRAFGVRDWRCYGVAFLWPPVLAAVQAANLTLFLVGGIGLAWTLRSRLFALGLVVALLLSAKLFLWPLFLWLVVTRRFRAAAWAVALAVVLNAAAWIAIGAGSVSAYVRLLHNLTLSETGTTYTLKAVLERVGASSFQATTATWLAVAILALIAWRLGRGSDATALAYAVFIALVASPIVWLHYFALLLVPVALLWPRLNWIWFVPLATMFCPGRGSGGLLQTAAPLAVLGLCAIAVSWSSRPRRLDGGACPVPAGSQLARPG
jgi:alpha-1,2-mannosyltransferase